MGGWDLPGEVRHIVVATPEERTRDYGNHNRIHECCITFSKRGPERLEHSKAFEMLLLGACTLSTDGTYAFLHGIWK